MNGARRWLNRHVFPLDVDAILFRLLVIFLIVLAVLVVYFLVGRS